MYGRVEATLEGHLPGQMGLVRAATEHQGGSHSAIKVDGEGSELALAN